MPQITKQDVSFMSATSNTKMLIRALSYKKDAEVRKHAAAALGKEGGLKALKPLLHALHDNDNGVREYVAIGLGWLDDPRAVKALISMLHDDSSCVRREAARSLGRIGDPGAFEALIAALGDEETVQNEIVMALGKIGDPRAMEPIKAACKLGHRTTEANIALGLLGENEVGGALIKALDKDFPDTYIIKALEKLKTSEAIPVLLKIAGRENYLSKKAVAAVRLIEPGLDDPKLHLVSCFLMINSNVYTLTKHNLTRVEFEQIGAEIKIPLEQSYEHSGPVQGCHACENLIEPYVAKRQGGLMPIGYELGDGKRHTLIGSGIHSSTVISDV